MFNLRLVETGSHVGAMLFKIETAVRMEMTRQTCTDVACTWNKASTKGVTCKPIAEIEFYTTEYRKNLRSRSGNQHVPPKPTSEEKDSFLGKLAKLKKKVYMYILIIKHYFSCVTVHTCTVIIIIIMIITQLLFHCSPLAYHYLINLMIVSRRMMVLNSCTCLTTCEIYKLYDPTAHEMTDEHLDNFCVEKFK